MTTTVQIPASRGGTNVPYNDGTGAYGMKSNGGYGYATYLFPMLSEYMAQLESYRLDTSTDASTATGEAAGAEAAQLAATNQANLAQQSALTAVAQASLASIYAQAASSVAQQDLSGLTAAALHRSPNAIVAQPIIIDPSKDSDGGAWVERMADKSWMQETLNGTYLGAHASEMDARDYFGSLGATSIVTGDSSTFTGGVGGWTVRNATYGSIASVGGKMRMSHLVLGQAATIDLAMTGLTIGQRYSVRFARTQGGGTTGNMFLDVRTAAAGGGTSITAGTTSSVNLGNASVTWFVATATTHYLVISDSSTWAAGSYWEVDDFTVKPVDLSLNPSGAFYPSSADGKFYRLWKNILRNNRDITGAGWLLNNVSGTATRDSAGNVTFGASGSDQVYVSGTGLSIPAGVPMTSAVKLSGSGTVRLNVFDGNGTTMGSPGFQTITLTATPTWYALNYTTTVAGVNGGLYVANNAAGTPTTFVIHGAQHQFGTIAAGAIDEEVKGADQNQTETLRGNVAKFGRMAAVPEASRVVLYAIDQPGMPMWMVFSLGTVSYTVGNAVLTTGISSLAYVNGKLFAGNNSAADGHLLTVDFAVDSIHLRPGSVGYGGFYRGNIAQRNAGRGFEGASGSSGFSPGGTVLPSKVVYAVSVTTLPDAPVDPVTGLQVPTVAAATAAGTSVIRHDGAVQTPIPYGATNVGFDARGNVVTVGENGRNYRKGLAPSYSTYVTHAGGPLAFNGATNTLSSVGATVGRQLVAARSTDTFVLHLIRDNDAVTGSCLAASIANTYNTGWQIGDVRRTLLCDTLAGAVSDANLVPAAESGFDADTGYWTKMDAGITVSGGKANFAAVPDVMSIYRAGNTFTAGRAYTVTFTIDSISAGGIRPYLQGTFGTTRTTPGTYSEVLVCGTAPNFNLQTQGVTTAVVDDFTIGEAIADRSYKAKGIRVYGPGIIRTAVAAAAQLVAYSGFTAASYLQEAYSADLDLGTAGFRSSVYFNAPLLTGSATPAPDGVGPAQSYVSLANFPVTATMAPAMNTADWTKGTGWSAPGANSFSCDGTQAGVTDLQWVAGSGRIPVANSVRRWTVTVSAISGTLVVYPNSGLAISITAPGTYTGLGAVSASGTGILRMNSAGQTCTGSVVIEELGPTVLFDRSAAGATPYQRLSMDAFGRLIGTVSDGTTTRTATTTSTYNTGTFVKGVLEYDTSGTVTIKVNGNTAVTATGAPLLTLNNASAVLTVGNDRTLTSAFPGSLTMVKLTATIPSAELGKWVYEQEKAMFLPGAQITLPDSGALVDLAYDDKLGCICTASAANEATFTGLVRTAMAPAAAGSITRIGEAGGVKMIARSTTNPGVDITIPARNLKADLASNGARFADTQIDLDWVGGFTANISNVGNGTNQFASVTGFSAPAQTTVIGAQFTSASGVAAGSVIAAMSGTLPNWSSIPFTAVVNGAAIAFTDFILPVGYEAKTIFVDGALKYEGATRDWVRRFDGLRETIRFATAPGATARVQIKAALAARRAA